MREKRNPFQIIRSRHVTEKAGVLENLKSSASNPCLAKCEKPKYVFLVDPSANKQEIARAIESIYADKKIKVINVNTITIKPKPRRVRGRFGKTAKVKKAVVTLDKNDNLDG